MPVPVTPEEMKSPLYKYFEMDIKPTPPETVAKIMAGGFDPTAGLHPTDCNKLFDDGYLPGEFGYFPLEDGGLMVANLTPMPGVTPEMFDWWFAWHGLSSLRYKIWDKDDHYYCQSLSVEKNLDSSLSMKERYWDTEHDIKEAMMDGMPPVPVHLHFVNPLVLGYDPEKLKNFKGTIICTPGPGALMSHFVRPTADGCELRTRFWLGYVAENGKVSRLPGPPMEDMFAKALLVHNVKEFTHLAEILPSVYAEFKDNFTVDL